MFHDLLLQLAQVPVTSTGFIANWQKPVIMTVTCLLVLIIASRSIDRPHDAPKMPLPLSSVLFNDVSVGGFLGAMSFGHVLGTLAILAVASFT
ncbi:photosystem I reaction center subunit PsaK [Oculatella sp. LEGE 06141]|uniref:photosystem I reaction center subunit PsaK n=1 Tax=Oculatella sp. LEGE 06141 TaxID=1828648 RepID=UPI0018824089|nr:photosystem I reaction center subunit PsaK [Oculatella sp. LEGE 06141]MBE9177236.1 photosystem I reaction center subunit PsaK [Oculatella sp. LEGE 06141]